MTAASALDWVQRMLVTATTVGAPLVLLVVIVGLVIAILQAATQVNDAAVGFAPKLVAVLVTVAVLGEWMLVQMRDFTAQAIGAIATLGP